MTEGLYFLNGIVTEQIFRGKFASKEECCLEYLIKGQEEKSQIKDI